MKVFDISILNTLGGTEDPIPLVAASDLSSFGYFQRQEIKEMLTILSKTFTKHTRSGQRQSITHVSYVVHCYVRSDGLAGSVVTDQEYPSRVAFVLLTQVLDEFTIEHVNSWRDNTQAYTMIFAPLEEYLVKYQDPAYQDPAASEKMTKIQKDVNGTAQIMQETISTELNRVAMADELVEKSYYLSEEAQVFSKTKGKKTNDCCSFLFC